MKKSIFVSLGLFALLAAGAASLAKKQDSKEVKADDPVQLTLNFHSFSSNSGDANVITLKFTPETSIPTGWDVAPITQVSRDAFWINGVPTQDDGNCVIQKLDTYKHQICIDSIKWSKYHDYIQTGDTVLVQGKWQSVYETTTYDITITPIYLRYTGSGWERLETYDIYLNLSINQSLKTNKNELTLTPTAENPIPPDAGWSVRLNSSANDCLSVNGVAASKTTQILKLLEYRYIVYMPDTGFTINDNDVVKIQGIYTYSTALLSFHVHVTTLVVQWTGTEWALPASDFYSLADSSADNLEAGNLLSNIGKWNSDHSKQCVKNFDQNADSLVYKSDANSHTGVYFTSTSGNDGEFRVYFPDNIYKAETKGYAMTQLTFDYIYENSNTVGENSRNPGLTSDGYFVATPEHVSNNFTVQALLHNNASNMYYDIEVELVNDGKLHSVTLNLAYGSVMGFGFKVWDFNGTFFMSNVHADYQVYNANLDAMYGLLKMYDSENDQGYTSCADYYAGAKAGYLALETEEKALFASNAAYGSARARLSAWAEANGEVLDLNAGTITANARALRNVTTKNNTIVIVVVVACSSITLLGVILILRKKRQHS